MQAWPERAQRWLVTKYRDPVAWTGLIQVVKTVFAAVVAWVVAVRLFHLPQPFLAPWAALLVVHATVYRTFAEGAKQVAAAVLGVVLAWGAGNLLGMSPASLGLMMLAALLVGKVRWLRDEATTIAATALIVLTTGFATNDHVLLGRLFDTAIGIVVGLLVNAVVWPPLRDLSAARAIDDLDDSMGVLLHDIAARLRHDEHHEEAAREWVDRTTELDDRIDRAWALVRQARESGRWNPRRDASKVRSPGEHGEVLHRIEQAVAETRSMALTLAHSLRNMNTWEPDFRDRWLDLLDRAGGAVTEADSEALLAVRRDLNGLAHDLASTHALAPHWPEYGGLIVNLRNVVAAMDRVAASQPVTGRTGTRSVPSLRG